MRFEPFALERWLPEVAGAEVNLAGALSVPLQYRDLIDGLDLDRDIGYRSTRGSLRLREEIGSLYATRRIDPEEVLVTTGTAEANFLLLSSLLEPGDELILVVPTYMQSVGIAQAVGAKVTTVALHEPDGWALRPDELQAILSPRTKAILLTNPNNPTGSWLAPPTIQAVCRLAARVGAYVIADEALRGLEAGNEMAPSPLELYERGVSTGSLSKIGLSGIRLGWVVGPRGVVEQCWVHKDYTTLAHSGLSELLAEVALEPGNIERFRSRARDFVRTHSALLMEWIGRHPTALSCVRPVAGGSAFPALHLPLDAIAFCRRAIQEASVALSPGDYFGAPNHFRIRFGARRGVLLDGLRRLDTFLVGLKMVKETR
jgi:aspartate/methionine/tyrosine aminotransferase